MHNPPVHWSEGMFLRPHHFQAADRYWLELTQTSQHFDHPVGYGVYRIGLSSEALLAGALEITGLQGRWKSGPLLHNDDNHVLRLDLKGRLPADLGNNPIFVYLALPGLQEGQRNVGYSDDAGQCRFVEFSRACDDESAGGNRQEVALKQFNARILLSTEDTSGYDLMPLCRIRRSPAGDGQLLLDQDYYPPCLSVQSWPELASTMRAIYDVIGSRVESLSEQIQSKGISLSSQAQGDLEKLLLLHTLNEALGELSCLTFAPGIHPLVAYTALCKIVGRCSLFGPDMTIGEVPRYNHEELAPIFKWALDQIRRLIFSVKEDLYEQRYFVGAGRGMQVSLEPEWFGAEWDWYFGVEAVNLKPPECMQLLKSIDWKLGSADQVEQLFEQRAPGVILRPVAQTPRALPSRGNWLYFQITRETEAWRHVQITQTMAMRVRSEQIANLSSLEGTKRLRLSVKGNIYGLEFAIFAVRKRV